MIDVSMIWQSSVTSAETSCISEVLLYSLACVRSKNILMICSTNGLDCDCLDSWYAFIVNQKVKLGM